MMGLSSTTIYYPPKATRAERTSQEADLRGHVDRVQAEYPRDGCHTMLHYLRRSAVKAEERKLRRVMKKYDLQASIRRA